MLKVAILKCNSNQKGNSNKCRRERENPKKQNVQEKKIILNPATCRCNNGKYVGSITDNSVIMFDGIIEEAKTVPKTVLQQKYFNIALMIAVSIYCFFKKHREKEKHFFHATTPLIETGY